MKMKKKISCSKDGSRQKITTICKKKRCAANTCICLETIIKTKLTMFYTSILLFSFCYRKYLFNSIKTQSGILFLCINLSHSFK